MGQSTKSSKPEAEFACSNKAIVPVAKLQNYLLLLVTWGIAVLQLNFSLNEASAVFYPPRI